jgi:NAD(P)-dependent dehydrogenase (short-subunit alcohol dehydrogenase family)
LPADKIENFGKQVPLQRPAQPAELAPYYVMLASQDGSYMTAAVIPVVGGNSTM